MRRFLIKKAYRAAYLAIMASRLVFGGQGRGAMVVVWHNSRVLLVKPSYVPYFTFPGGRANRGEKLMDAGLRELWEETGIAIAEDQLTTVNTSGFRALRQADILGLYELTLSEVPEIVIDGVEIEDFCFATVAEAKKMNIYRKARIFLEQIPDGHQ